MTPQKALNRAKVKLMTSSNSVFLSTILFNLTHRITDEIPTAATDGLTLLLNPDFFLGLTDLERVGLLAHETMHVAWNHMARGKDLDHQKYNVAGDYVINNFLDTSGFELPKDGYLNHKYDRLSTKQIYELLPDIDEDDDDKYDIIYDTEDTPDAKEVNLTNIIIQAVTQAKLQGDDPGAIPGEIQVMIDKIINPKLPWQVLLQNYMSAFAKEDYSWTKPNRRFMPDYYLPTAHSEAVGHIAIAVDTSGSVSDKTFMAFLSEIQGIKEMLSPELLSVLDFDTTIKKIHRITHDESIKDIKFHGRGGTDIAPVWKWIKKNNPLVTIIFSDMYFRHPSEKIDSEVLWISVDNPNAKLPYGDTIHLST